MAQMHYGSHELFRCPDSSSAAQDPCISVPQARCGAAVHQRALSSIATLALMHEARRLIHCRRKFEAELRTWTRAHLVGRDTQADSPVAVVFVARSRLCPQHQAVARIQRHALSLATSPSGRDREGQAH